MTYGQLFMVLNPNVKVIENGTCVWIYFDGVNHDTFRTEWWNKEIPDEVLKTQEPKFVPDIAEAILGYRPKVKVGHCPSCGVLMSETDKFCRKCGQAVKWNG